MGMKKLLVKESSLEMMSINSNRIDMPNTSTPDLRTQSHYWPEKESKSNSKYTALFFKMADQTMLGEGKDDTGLLDQVVELLGL